ncbi:DNA (cytosine-5-)-methyltransferase [Deinococcus navajonensis]|uniref:Cytosine-specific methyltransferase n=1 Tax=Deinococcus navajonensis TaxID=309884 RepID=A0ABV8XR81_9DEIO
MVLNDVKPPLASPSPGPLAEEAQPSHGIALWRRRKHFSAVHTRWRRETVPLLDQLRGQMTRVSSDTTPVQLRDLLDEEAARLQVIDRILQLVHPPGSEPLTGLDLLMFAVLEDAAEAKQARAALMGLKQAAPSWADLAGLSRAEVAAVLQGAGVAPFWAGVLLELLSQVRQWCGGMTLEPLRDWTPGAALIWLSGLPGVTRQTALRVLLQERADSPMPPDAAPMRVLGRLGILNDAGLQDPLDVDTLRSLVPPDLRRELHRTLTAHAEEICTPRTPRCGDCAVNRFCRTWRGQQVELATRSARPTMVDLFCGAGGLSEGFRQAGFRTVFAIDQNPVAIRSFRLNHPEVPSEQVVCDDLRNFRDDARRILDALGGQQVDVLVGGPPCQGFSRAGWRSRTSTRQVQATADDRNYLFEELIGLLEVLRPRVVIMENVPGIGEVRFPDGTSFLEVTVEAMRSLGYDSTVWTLDAATYGVPQHRVRRIIVGSRIGPVPPPPTPTHRAVSNQYRETVQPTGEHLKPPVTVEEAIGDLPPLPASAGQWIDLPRPRVGRRRTKGYSGEMGHPMNLLFSHVTRYHNDLDLRRYATMRPGDNYLALLRRDHTLENYRTDGFEDKYFRLAPDRPSKTIVAHLQKDGNSFIHPSQPRSISVREAARLQSFSDEYIFTGSRGDQFLQIGNAVPPLLARTIAHTLMAHLDATAETDGDPVA